MGVLICAVIFLCLEPNSSLLEPQQRCPSSGQKLSISESSLVLHKQFHSELTERLQKLLNDRSKDPPPQESADHHRKASSTKRGSRETDSENTRATVTVPKTQRAQRGKQSKENRKEKAALEANADAAKASEKTFTNKTVENQKQSQVKDDIKMAISRRDKVWILCIQSVLTSCLKLLMVSVISFILVLTYNSERLRGHS